MQQVLAIIKGIEMPNRQRSGVLSLVQLFHVKHFLTKRKNFAGIAAEFSLQTPKYQKTDYLIGKSQMN